MRLIRIFFLIVFFPFLSGVAQTAPEEVAQVNKYLLSAKGPSGELILTTGRIVKTIALSRPQSMEIAHLWVNYAVSVALSTDRDGSTTARISFKDLHLTGDVKYKGFDISDFIFPSSVSFKLIASGRVKTMLANVREAKINPGNCTISVSLGKNVTEPPVLDRLCFYHSDDDYELATGQMKLVERYFTATWLMKRADQLMDAMQFSQLKNPSGFIASLVEVSLLNDWISRQRFDMYPYFQKIDSLMFTKQIQVNRYKRNLIEEDFSKANTINRADLSTAAALFAASLSNYFDAGQGDINRSAYLTQMAGSSMTNIGFKELLDFTTIYNATHPNQKIEKRDMIAFSAMIEQAMIRQAAKLVETDQYSEAMHMLNTSDKYSLLLVDQQQPFEKELIRNLSGRLYKYYLDIAVKAMLGDVFRVSTDYYRKALAIKHQYPEMVKSDPRERYIADMTCKNMLQSAERSFKSNDIAGALSGYEEVIRIADSARLKSSYETARIRLQAISGRPSGFRPWVGDELAVVVPKAEPEVVSTPSGNNPVANKESIASKRRRVTETEASTAVPVKDVDSKKLLAVVGRKQPHGNKRTGVANDSTRLLAMATAAPKSIRDDRKEYFQHTGKANTRLSNKSKYKVETTNDQRIGEKLKSCMKSIGLKIWSGDVDSSRILLSVADSLQDILSKDGDNGFMVDLKSLRINFNNLICDQQKTVYNKAFDQIKQLLKQKDFVQASAQLKLLVAKSFDAECAIDKVPANQLLVALGAPITYKKLKSNLDSLKSSMEPEVMMEAFAKVSDYYRTNEMEKWGMEAPDVMVALQSRKETAFLMKASMQFVNNHQPVYALTLLKSIVELEPKPDKTQSLQKRVGEMLASGDHTPDQSVDVKLNSYALDGKWFATLITAYKKQWKLFGK